jgi:hypothetical protein
MRSVCCFLIIIVFAITTPPELLVAQGGFGVAGHVGTMGVGVDVAVTAAPKIGLRAGGNIMAIEDNLTYSGVEFTAELQSPQFTAMVDLYPAGGFRLSGGLRYSNSNIVLTAVSRSVDLGGTNYTLDSLVGTIVTPDISPYVGIGFGNPAARKLGFFLDLGVAYQGEPEFQLDAFGSATTLPGFDTDLEQERQDIEDSLGMYFKFYPVISVGFSIGF